jgi:chromosome segregation ATPase
MSDAGIIQALKDFFKAELGEIRDSQTAQEAKNNEFQDNLTKLSGDLVQSQGEVQRLMQELEKKQQGIDGLQSKIKSLEDFDIGDVRDKVLDVRKLLDGDEVQSIKGFSFKIDALEPQIADMKLKVSVCEANVNANRTRTDEFGDQVRNLAKVCESMQSSVKDFSSRLDNAEKKSETVANETDLMRVSIENKYSNLWKSVEKALNELQEDQMTRLKDEIDRKNDGQKNECQVLLDNAQRIMARVQTQRKQQLLQKQIVTGWRQQMWISARRKMGISALHSFFQRRSRDTFHRWTRRTAVDHLRWVLRKEYQAKIPDFTRILEDLGLERRCDKLDQDVKKLQKDKCSHEKVDKCLQDQTVDFDKKLEALNDLRRMIKENLDAITSLDGRSVCHDGRLQSIDKRIEEAMKSIADVNETLVDFSKTKEVQQMMRDILLIWNSIKQLDAAKADKKDVDNFAVENSKRAKRVEQRFEDLESESNTKLQEGVMSMHERLQELGGRVEENSRAFRHWQQMWESLAGFVEDLVAKIAEIQGFDPGRLPPGAPGGGAARPGSRGAPVRNAPSLPGGVPPRPPAGPPTDMDGGGAGSNSARGQGESVETMERWISSARNIVDGAIDNAMSQAPPRRATAGRPQSAHAPRTRGDDADSPSVVVSGTRVVGLDGGNSHVAGPWRTNSTSSLRQNQVGRGRAQATRAR